MTRPNKLRRSRIVTVLGICGLLASFTGGSFAASASTARASSSPILIGGTLGLTGAFSEPSAEYRAVYNMWASGVNAHGGLLGRKVKLIVLNDNSTPATATSEYQTLLTHHVDFVLAPYTTYIGAPIVPLVKAAGKVLFNGGFVGIQYFDQDQGWMVGSYTYQEPDYPLGVFKLIASLPAAKRPTRIGILAAQNPFTIVAQTGYKGRGGALNYAKQYHLKVVFNETYPSTTTDFTSTIQKAKAAGVQALFVLGLPDDSDLIVKSIKVANWKPALVCACGSQVTTLANWPALGSATNGILGTDVAWGTENLPGLAALQSFATKRGEKVVPSYDVTAYAILQMLQQAVTGTHSLNQALIRRWLLSHTVRTAAGTFKLLANGSPPFREVITQTIGARQLPVWPPSLAKAALVVPIP